MSCSLNFPKETQVPCVLKKIKIKNKKKPAHNAISFINIIIFYNLELKSPRLDLPLGKLKFQLWSHCKFFLKHVT